MRKSLLVFCSLFVLSIFAPAVAQATLTLRRGVIHGDAVHGRLTGAYECDTLENDDYLISTGKYTVKVGYSPTLSKKAGHDVSVPRLTDAWGVDDGILIHAGNGPGDSQGCILVGTYDEPGAITRSQYHLGRLMNVMGNGTYALTIV